MAAATLLGRTDETPVFSHAGEGTPAPLVARPSRVCFLIDRLSNAGTESQLLALIRHVDRARVEPYLCLLGGEDATSRELEPADCAVMRLGIRSLHHGRTLGQAIRFARFLRGERIDVLQLYFSDSTYFGVTVGRLAGVRSIVGTRFNLGYSMTPVHRWLSRLARRFTDATMTNCAACRASVIDDEWVRPDEVHVIENGVESTRVAASPMGRPSPQRHIGLVANLRPIKDPATFVRAAERVRATHPEARFSIAGEGELRPHLEQLIRELGLQDRVALIGRVTDVPAYLAGIDIAVLCSRSEGSPNAVLEYMSAGRAVVASAVGGTRELIEEGRNGFLVPPDDPEALATAIRRYLDDPPLAIQCGEAARGVVQRRHDMKQRARRFETFCHELAERTGRIGSRGF